MKEKEMNNLLDAIFGYKIGFNPQTIHNALKMVDNLHVGAQNVLEKELSLNDENLPLENQNRYNMTVYDIEESLLEEIAALQLLAGVYMRRYEACKKNTEKKEWKKK